MEFKLKTKHIKKAYKITRKIAPIALMVAEAAFPGAKPIRTASKVMETFF